MKFIGYKVIYIYVILLCILLGCSKDSNQSKVEPKDKAPNSLVELASGMDEILSSVGNIERIILEVPTADKKDEGENKPLDVGKNSTGVESSNEGEQDSKGEEKNSSGEGNGSSIPKPESTEQEKKKKEEEQKKLWDEISKKLDEIHSLWNSFEAEGIKKGATKEMGDKFENNFNKMTKAIEDKNIIDIYDYSAESFLSLKPLFDLYTEEIGGDVSVIKYSAYKAYTKTLKGENQEAAQLLTGREENINKIRLKMTEEKEKEQVEKVSMAIGDFKNSLSEKSRMLHMIKKDIIIENLKKLE